MASQLLDVPPYRRAFIPGRFGGVVYGPVASRRLGRSLGVNLSPPEARVCSFQCSYCLYPRWRLAARPRWPAPCALGAALETALAQVGPLDSITISGHGEPTLHPNFPAAVDAVLAVARRARPDVPVRILTNGTGALRAPVRRALDALDERIVKLDAEAERLDRPVGQPLGALYASLAMLRDFTAQSCFVEGSRSNTGERALGEWIELVAELRPRAVQVYTIDSPPAAGDARPVPAVRLDTIASELQQRARVEAVAYA